ncbi:MAG: SRPBCC family protein [Myxococcota bacterium]
MREHRYAMDLPHSADRVWALMQDYDRWSEYAPAVIRVEVLHPGDRDGNGLLRRVIYPLPFGRRGAALELVTDVKPARGYRFMMIGRKPGNDRMGALRLEPLGRERTRLHFEERFHLTTVPLKWFEGPLYRFINKNNEASMRRLSEWLSEHPEYRPDLA